MALRLIAAAAAWALLACPAEAARSVGFDLVQVPQADGATLPGAVWYPSDAAASAMSFGNGQQDVARDAPVAGDHLPLAVISHGALGSMANDRDLAIELAQAGFVAIAVSYDQFSPAGVLQVGHWTQGLHSAIDYALTRWPYRSRIDGTRIGAFGFSLGGLATLIAVGGRPDPGLVAGHCKAAPQDWSCRMAGKLDVAELATPSSWIADDRIGAAVLAVPAMGYVFGRAGLSTVHVPVQLWEAGHDHVLDPVWNSAPIARDLPGRPEVHVVADADHADFTSPCSAQVERAWPRLWCRDASGFDRAAFHVMFDAAVVGFFRTALHVGP